MSRLKELRLHGFKSFAEPTVFVFDPGVTAVIGPNGSGKSNMADAIRWVLGEQSNRLLRTRRSDDVIFGGSESRKPIGLAEVILTLDNADRWLPIDFEEVTIARRAYRSGDPEYLINGSRARLRDVVELLAAGRLGANELVVVGQGTVDAALSLRPDERRQLFEEAAGVKSLQVRRNEALARLGRARENVTRITDVIRELRPQVRRLGLQAEHQEAHDRLGGRLRALVEEHHGRRRRLVLDELGEARRRSAAATADAAAEREAQLAGRQAVTEAEEQYWAAERESRALATAWEEAREAVIRAEGRHGSLVERDLDLAAEEERARRDQAELAADSSGASRAPDDADEGEHREQVAAAERTWRIAVERARAADMTLLNAEQVLAEARNRAADRMAESGRRAELAGAAQARRERLESELATESRALEEAARLQAERAGVKAGAEGDLARAEVDAAERAGAEVDTANAATRAETALVEAQERVARLSQELTEVGPPGTGVDLVERLRGGGYAPLADHLGSIPDDLLLAVAAAVGDPDRAVVWDTQSPPSLDDARGDASLLTTNADGLPDRDAALAAVGATATLADLLDAAQPLAVLSRTVVAPDLDALLHGWARLPAGWAAVTRTGDRADPRGVVSLLGRAGERRAPQSLAARHADLARRLDRARAELEGLEAQAHETQTTRDRAREAADAARAAVDAARIARRQADDEALLADGAAERAATRIAALRDELARIPDVPAAGSTPDEGDGDIDALQAEADRARAEGAAAATERDAARDAWNRAVVEADARDAASADRRAAAARLDERASHAASALLRITSERERLAAELHERAAALETACAAEAEAVEARARADERREALREALLDAERRLSGGAGRLAELESVLQAAVAEASRLEETLVGLDRERELSLEGVAEATATPDEELAATLGELSDEDLAEELRGARRTLHQIGSVNPFAIEEHRELSARLEDLTAQESDLRSATASTEELIARLDEEISSQFKAAFAAIGQRFDEYCRLLFAGGSASLELSDDAESEAPGGIEIAVRPPGKRLQRLAMLSGGERALAGVALLFAMLSVNPVPFCVLDEVDAALDEANIGRFADALRRLAETIDFVVITHNRATIETADTIYGVTMTDAAVSRVLSLRLADLPVEVAV